MQFSVGDKVVHPKLGPGRITGVVSREGVGGATSYYIIDMGGQHLTVHVPVLRAEELGLRPAMSLSMLPQVLSTLRSSPCQLPDDPKQRQEQIGVSMRGGQVLPLAGLVRDLTWYGERAHLTKKDSDLLKQGQARLAAEMALASEASASDSTRLIGSTMAAALASALG